MAGEQLYTEAESDNVYQRVLLLVYTVSYQCAFCSRYTEILLLSGIGVYLRLTTLLGWGMQGAIILDPPSEGSHGINRKLT